MTDIVERLRAVSGPADLYLDHTNECRRLCGEAADEIERLRRENGQIKRELWSKRDELRIARGLPLEGEP